MAAPPDRSSPRASAPLDCTVIACPSVTLWLVPPASDTPVAAPCVLLTVHALPSVTVSLPLAPVMPMPRAVPPPALIAMGVFVCVVTLSLLPPEMLMPVAEPAELLTARLAPCNCTETGPLAPATAKPVAFAAPATVTDCSEVSATLVPCRTSMPTALVPPVTLNRPLLSSATAPGVPLPAT